MLLCCLWQRVSRLNIWVIVLFCFTVSIFGVFVGVGVGVGSGVGGCW